MMRRLAYLSVLLAVTAQSASFLSETDQLPPLAQSLKWPTAAWAPAPPVLADILAGTNANRSFLAISGEVNETTYRTYILEFANGIRVSIDSTSVPGVTYGSLDWADWNLDGNLDLAITGQTVESDGTPGRLTSVYDGDGSRWDPSNGLSAEITNDLAQVDSGSVQWGDFDADGDPDLLVTGGWWNINPLGGATTFLQQSRIHLYENDTDPNTGSKNLTENEGVISKASQLPPVHMSDVAWADYDGDGDFDLAIAGFQRVIWQGGNNPTAIITDVYENAVNTTENRPSGVLSKLSDIQYPRDVVKNLMGGGMAWGDLDNDGLLDLAITGYDSIENVARNNFNFYVLKSQLGGGLTRAQVQLQMTDIVAGPLLWGDLDNDGDQDIVTVGRDNTGEPGTRILENIGDGTLGVMTGITGEPLLDLADGTVQSGDLDGDGSLDLMISGRDAAGVWKAQLLRLQPDVANSPPSEPLSPNSLITGREVEVTWDASSDGTSPRPTLGYEIVAFRDDKPIFSSRATFDRSRVSGRIGRRIQNALAVNPAGYNWFVRAIDASGSASDWSNPELLFVQEFVLSSQSVLAVNVSSSSAWIDHDNDGDVDLMVSGRDAGGAVRSRLYDNVRGVLLPNGQFTTVSGVSLGGQAWGDLDNDGDLDVAVTGQRLGTAQITAIYTNNGDGSFSRIYSSSRTVTGSRLVWGDVDNDGDLDLVATGQESYSEGIRTVTLLYRNLGGTTPFTSESLEDLKLRGSSRDANGVIEINGVFDGWLSLFDFDLDGDLDLTINGSVCDTIRAGTNGDCGNFQEIGMTELYRNDGAGRFKKAFGAETFLPSYWGQHRWGDLNDDGTPDLVLVAWNWETNPVAADGFVMTYLADSTRAAWFEPLPPTENGLYFSSMELVDLNNDGDLDILVAGANDFGSQIKYLDNNLNSVGLGVFGGVGIRLLTETQSNNGSITAADFDGDNDVDFVVNGSKRSAAGVELPSTVVFESTNAQFFNVNRAPNDPSALTAVVDTTSSVVLKWDAVTDVQNGSSVTYSLRVGTTIDGDEIKSGAWPIGLGNVGYNRSMPLHSLADGQYFWAVKSVDHAFMASSWTSGGEFTVDTEPPAVAALRGRGGGKDTLRIGIDGEITLTIAFDDGDVGTGMDTENIDMTVRVSSSSSNLETTDIDTLVSDGSWDAAGVLWTGRLTVSADFDTGAVDNVYVHLHSARDKRGNTMPDTAFATLLIIDTVRPSVNLSATYPRAGQTVPTSRNLNVVFDEPMAESSVAAANVRVKGVGGSWTRTGATTGSLDPNDQDFQPNREYFLVIPGSVVDLASNAIGDDIEIPFKTPSKVTRDGGTVANSDSTATMYVPPSRDAADVEMFFDDPDLAVTPASDPSGGRSTGLVHVVASEPARDFVGAPALLTVHYPDAIGRLASIQASEDSLRLFYADTTGSAAKWTFVGGTIDPDANTLVAPIEHLGTYRLFLGGLPDGEVISLSDLDCQPRVFKAIGLSDLRAATSVLFSLQQDADVTVRVFNRTGRLVRTVADNQSFTAGRNTIDWDGRDEDGGTVASGTYAISVVGDGQQAVKVVAVVNK